MTSNDYRKLVGVFEKKEVELVRARVKLVYMFRLQKAFYGDLKRSISSMTEKYGKE